MVGVVRAARYLSDPSTYLERATEHYADVQWMNAHLDPARRTALYRELEMLGAQVWITGADPAAFAEIEDRAQFFRVSPGWIAPR